MAIPWNIRGSASPLFFQDKQSSQYKALLANADAARYFLRMTCTGENSHPKKTVSQFLSEWKILVDKFRPTRTTSLSNETRMLIYKRDGGRCCLMRTTCKSYTDHNLEYVHIISPLVFSDPELSEGAAFFEMLEAFLSRTVLENWRSVLSSRQQQESEKLDDLWLLSKEASDAEHPDTTINQSYNVYTNMFSPRSCMDRSFLEDTMTLENHTSQLTPMLNEELLGLHARFSKSLAWMETEKQMNVTLGGAHPFLLSFRRLWKLLPPFVRASVYNGLLWVGSRIYGPSLSMTGYRLPFGLYLRRGPPLLAPKYHVEAYTLHLVEQSTSIPAPRGIDVLDTPRFSYLLMTRVPGRPIGQILDTMTDEELREISNKATEFQICNSEGGGILDWRIPDSQRDELRFKTETEFNKYLTDPFWEEIRRRAAISHDIRHKITFTHGDLNPRNILAENGKITGIVDWENAGWFPEYWEYTKAHSNVVDRVFEGYRDELVVENMLSDPLGPF
ncbi:kinase-like domain-containing protein [Aspergillus transmontanensis]|uniref:Kinase-like domain-containing protein n=1 Tax=Aspergillus transmontanensis TaxID=1034304 RepID=A0A5N6VM50_9EURO|nr:kinase-like domain-containing protein [Aspergillus transmontanensis]